VKDTIVVGLDGSQGSAHALHWLVSQATEDQHVVAVHSIRPMGEFVLDLPVNGLGDWRKTLAWELEHVWCKPLRDAGISHESVTVDASPAKGIADVASARRAKMIVVGAQGHGSVAGRMLGGVSYRLPHTASQPVVIVPPDWSETPE